MRLRSSSFSSRLRTGCRCRSLVLASSFREDASCCVVASCAHAFAAWKFQSKHIFVVIRGIPWAIFVGFAPEFVTCASLVLVSFCSVPFSTSYIFSFPTHKRDLKNRFASRVVLCDAFLIVFACFCPEIPSVERAHNLDETWEIRGSNGRSHAIIWRPFSCLLFHV